MSTRIAHASKLTRRGFLAMIIAAACAIGWAAPVSAASDADAQRLIKDLTDEAMAMASAQLTADQKQGRFRELLHSSFDLTEISRFILGRYWRTATSEQQREFLRLFEDLTVLTWVKRFDDYGGETMDVVQTTREGDQGLLIETRVNRSAGQPVVVTWRVRDKDGRLKVIDIVVEGVSMAITYRSEYGSALQSAGGLDGLLNAMRDKIAMLQGDRRNG